LIDWVKANATTAATPKSVYYFSNVAVATGGVNLSYTVGGGPAAANQTGVRSFCSTEEGVIRFSAVTVAPPISQAACIAFVALQ
jgi:hypothetical protein